MSCGEAGNLVHERMDGAISAREITYDFERLMREEGKPVKLLRCSEFGQAAARHMG